jgi:hypothetical protein
MHLHCSGSQSNIGQEREMPTLFAPEECILPESGELENPVETETLMLAATQEDRQAGCERASHEFAGLRQ